MGNLTMSRRTFVKTAAITGAAAAAFGASTHTALAEETYSSVSGNDTVAVKTCCRGCGKMECLSLIHISSRAHISSTRWKMGR